MFQKFTKTLAILLSCLFLVSCADDHRVDGEMAFDSESLMNMAESFLSAGDYGNAMRLYQRAANENPKHIPSRMGLAKTYQAIGATDAAINFYEQVLQLDPDNMAAKMGSGQMLITKNRPEDAIPYLTDLSRQDPDNHRIYNMLGLAHDLMGQQENAQMNYGRGLTLAPDNISLLNNLALSFAFEEQYAPSIRLLSKAINLDYTVTKAQHNLVLVYVLSGEEEAGRAIGSSIMTKEEMENNIRQYRWIKSLTPGQRAQAIFLGIKNFPDKAGQGLSGEAKKSPIAAPDVIPNDPKKRQLWELLKQAESSSLKNKEKSRNDTPNPVKSYTPHQKVHRVQLGSYPNTKLAHSGWKKIKRRSKGLLDSYEAKIKLVTLADGKNLFRLFVGNIEDRAIARTLCDELRQRNVDCLVLKTAKN
ncbi:MAG: hypothetical protein COB49_11885 [Alphaproteobacteria bacterium]|nr:MAG: hypothetical protein COB49_11885 [Alphaproteobacteria bacterium]